MRVDEQLTYTAFTEDRLIATGSLDTVLPVLKERFDRAPGFLPLVFEDLTGRQVDFDLRGDLSEVLARALPVRSPAGPGRPKLGVVSREISLLPRHWDWLEQQPNGASAAIRRLVDEARKRNPGRQRARAAMEAAGRFMTAMAGNRPGYEEATRALFAADRGRFEGLIGEWPGDVRAYALHLAEPAFFDGAAPAG